MAELTIRPDEIRDALDAFVQSYDAGEASREEIGRVSEAGDGIARVEGLPSCDGQRAAAVRGRHARPGAEPRRPRDRRRRPRRVRRHRGGPGGPPHGRDPLGPGGRRASSAASSTRSATRSTASGEIQAETRRALELQAPTVVQRQSRQGAADDRHQGHRLDDADRPRPAPADHRRPADRQDRDRDRHDHQPARQLGVGRPVAAGALHLRRDRPEGLDDRQCAPLPGGERRARVHDDRRVAGGRPGRLQVPRARTPARPSASTGCTPASTC